MMTLGAIFTFTKKIIPSLYRVTGIIRNGLSTIAMEFGGVNFADPYMIITLGAITNASTLQIPELGNIN